MMTPPLTPTIRKCLCGTEFVTLARTAKWCGRCRALRKPSRMTDPHAAKPAEPAHAGMTTKELCQAVGVGQSALQMWLQSGFLQAENIGIPGGGTPHVRSRPAGTCPPGESAVAQGRVVRQAGGHRPVVRRRP